MTIERLSGLDASFLYLETPHLQMHVGIVAVLDPDTIPGGYSFQRLRAHIHDRLPLAPVFLRRLAEVPLGLGHPVWVDDPDFDIQNHVHRAALPAPGGVAELTELTALIIGTRLDRSRPLWELWLVEGLADGRIALIGKIHHATVDGVSGAELLGVLLDLQPSLPTPSTSACSEPDLTTPSTLDLVVDAALQRLSSPFEIARTAWRTGQALMGVHRVRQEATGGKGALPLTVPRTSFNGAVTSRRRVGLASVSLTDVKQVKDALGVTVNDIVLALATSALRAYLLAGDELPPDPLVAVVPVSVTPDVADMHGANKISGLFVGLPTTEEDPLSRVAAIHADMEGAKEEHRALGASLLQDWVEHAAPSLFALSARVYSGMHLSEHHRPIANLVISNVPGPDFPLYLGGAELLAAFPLGPVMEGMGLNMTIMSYRGGLYWGLVACARTVPRLPDIADAIPEALAELLATAGLSPSSPSHAFATDPGGAPGTTRRRTRRASATSNEGAAPVTQLRRLR